MTRLSEPMLDDAEGPSVRVDSIEDARLYQSIKARLFDIEDEPVRVGMLRLIRRLGAGGMGEVFLAHDDELDRPVALKLVHTRLSHESRFAERMRREARALAKLAHTNVVHVYEVGEHDGRFFLAMEYIDGQNLGAWIRECSPTWRAVLDAYLAAGEGLVAAHAAGLTHRDFKPENVLRSNDGRVCVADFGLARVDLSTSIDDPSSLDDSIDERPSLRGSSEYGQEKTVTGTIIGTPNYMPLEQLRGELVDARSDQFAFCVALYEGLWGTQPFAQSSMSKREIALVEDRPALPPRSAVPRWVWPIVRRGLARDPARRWPDMRCLLDALRRAPLRMQGRRRALAVAVAVPLAVVGGWWGLSPSGEDPCADQVHALDEVWNPERRAAIEAVFSVTETAWGHDNGARVVEQIDRWSQRWIDARVEVCRTEQAGPDSLVAERQLECLEQRRGELEELLQIFASADAATHERAQSAVHGLADPLACEAIAIAGIGIDPPTAEHAHEVAALRRELAEVDALLLSGAWTDTLRRADRLLERARAIPYLPVEAEIRFARARAQLELGAVQDSRQELELAVDLAEAARHEHLAIEIWMFLVRQIASETNDAAAGERWFRRMRAAALGSRREVEYAGELALVEADVAMLRGVPEQAEPHLRRAIAEFEARGRRSELVTTRWVLARTLEQRGRADEAVDHYRQVRAETELLYGANHPKVAERCYDLGVALYERGDADEARAELERALSIWADTPATSTSSLLDGHLVLAMFDFEADHLDAAALHVDAAERVARDHAGDNPLALAQVSAARGAIEYRAGEFESASRELERAAQSFEAALGSSDPTALQTRTSQGWAAILAGDPARAVDALVQVRERIASLEGESSQSPTARLGLAASRLLLGDRAEALRELDALPAELEPFFALERELVRAFSGGPSEDSIARLRASAAVLGPTEQREFNALLDVFIAMQLNQSRI